MRERRLCACRSGAMAGAMAVFAAAATAQDFTHRGFFETNAAIYPQTAPGDS